MSIARLAITPLFATPEERQQGLTYLNQLRVSAGLIEFSSNSLLDQAAGNHTAYLVANNLFSHYEDPINYPAGFTGQTPTERGDHAGYKSSVTENLSAGNTTIEESIDSLFAAIYHRFGFLSFTFNEIGFGVERSASYYYQSVFGYNLGTSQINALCSGTTYTGGEVIITAFVPISLSGSKRVNTWGPET